MPTPFFPSELVTHIFESLYTSLRSNPHYSPVSINSIFAPFSLVDKRWRSIALPYLVRHFDRSSHAIPGFLLFIKKYNLTKEVKSIHFAFEIPTPSSFLVRQSDLIEKRYGAKIRRYEARDQCEKVEEQMEGWADETAGDAQIVVVRERKEKVVQEKQLWDPLILACMPFVEEAEVGKRPKDENFDDTRHIENWSELLNEGEYVGGAGEDVTHFLLRLKGPNVKQLRINLLSGVSIAEIPPSTPRNFPLVQDLTIHRYTGNSDQTRPHVHHPGLSMWSNLQRLSLTNVTANFAVFAHEITKAYLEPSATTLTHLELKVSQNAPRQEFHEAGMFNNLLFPSVQEVNLKVRKFSQSEEDAIKQRFPNAKHFSLKVEGET